MEEKSHLSVVGELPLPPSLPHPGELPLGDQIVDLLPNNVSKNSLATSTQTAAGVVTGAAVTIVSYRLFKTRSIKAVFQSKSLAKDMTYLGVLYGAAECSQQVLRGGLTGAVDDAASLKENVNGSLKEKLNLTSKENNEEKRTPSSIMASIDVSGVKNVSLFGASVAAPFFHYWYRFLDARFVGASPSIIVRKVLLDQLFASSSVSALFLLSIPAFAGDSDLVGPDSLLRKKFFSIYLAGCAIWPLMQSINFRFVSPRYRVAYLGFAAFLWTNILCFYRHEKETAIC